MLVRQITRRRIACLASVTGHMETPASRRDVVEPFKGCPPEIGTSLWTLQEARQRTSRYLDGISQDVLDWDPPGQRYSVATLLYHIAVIEVDWLFIDSSMRVG